MSETRTLQLLILDEHGSRLLVDCDAIPEVSVPMFERPAPVIIRHLRKKYGCEALCLFTTLDGACVVMECISAGERLKWIPAKATGELVVRRLEEARSKEGPFAQPGWINALRKWAPFDGSFEQYTGEASFSLLRFSSCDRAYWFKAVGEPYLREFTVTRALSDRSPQYVPHVVATKPDWHGLLLEHEQGPLLRDITVFSAWESVTAVLGRLQLEYAGRDEYLCGIGCADWRIEAFLGRLDPFLESMADLMALQSQTPPPRLSRSELLSLGDQLREICYRQMNLGLPNSIVHGDIGPDNIVLAARGPVFLDWAAAHIAPPFVSFAQLVAHLQKDHPECASWIENLRYAYAEVWEGAFDPQTVGRALRLAPVLAVSFNALDMNPLEVHGHSAKYARSLVRRIKREVETLFSMEAP